MTTQPYPLFLKFFVLIGSTCKHTWQQIKGKLVKVKDATPEELPIIPGQDQNANKKWVLAETSDVNNQNKNVVLVEVEVFPNDPYVADLSRPSLAHTHNYTIAGEDPNLRITHYPSNRLH
jgi:hypothetical protein